MNKNIIHIKKDNKSFNQIQDAVIELKNRGGTVQIHPGKYLSGPITLYSNIELHLQKGAELQISDDFALFKPVRTRWEGTESFAIQSLIFAENCSNITISGDGVINGLGSKWWTEYKNLRNNIISVDVDNIRKLLLPLNSKITGGSGGGGRETGFLRPSLIQFKNCTDSKIEGVTLKDSPFWNTHILYSRRIKIIGVTFLNPRDAPNTDGLDIDSSEYITVEKCHFDVGDDCLCLKSGMDDDGVSVGKATSYVTIKNCTMANGHGAIVLGSETSGGINNVEISECSFKGTDRGIRIKTRRGRGGTIDNITIKDIQMNKVIAPIVMNMYYKCGADQMLINELKSLEKMYFDVKRTPVISNIQIENVQATEIGSSAAFFFGLPESPIENITIKDIAIMSTASKDFSEPAMDLFYTKADGPEILYKFLKNPIFENITINNHSGVIMKEIPIEESLC